MATKTGSLLLIIGPMFSGKTTALQSKYNNRRISHQANPKTGKPLIFRWHEDNRYSDTNLVTHDQREIEAFPYSRGEDIDSRLDKITDIFIDEGQFLPNLKDWVIIWIKRGINVYIAALESHGDTEHTLWPEIQRLIPYAEIVKNTAVCFRCGGVATLTVSKTPEEGAIKRIGSIDLYEAVCIGCT